MISIIVATDKHGLIGNHNQMPWKCDEDLAHFKKTTIHQELLMGRKTYEGLPKKLANRKIHLATTQLEYAFEDDNVILCKDVSKLLDEWKEREDTLYVCGGAQIYQLAFPYVDELWISVIQGAYQGNIYIPNYTIDHYTLCNKESKEHFTLYHYKRKL